MPYVLRQIEEDVTVASFALGDNMDVRHWESDNIGRVKMQWMNAVE